MTRGGLQPAQPFGFAAPPAAVIRSGRASECWTVTAAEIDAWLDVALPGEAFVYAHGPQLVQGGAASRVADLWKAGDVTPHHKRVDDGNFDFLIRRNKKARTARLPVCDQLMFNVLLVLQEAASAVHRCPSDADIGEATGLTADQVKWQLKKLEGAKFITRRTVRTKADPRFRIVTVVATGATTAGPAE